MGNLAEDTVVRMRDFRSSSSRTPLTQALASGFAGWSEKAKSGVRAADDFIRAHPWQVAGIVAMVGLGTGFLAARLSGRGDRQS